MITPKVTRRGGVPGSAVARGEGGQQLEGHEPEASVSSCGGAGSRATTRVARDRNAARTGSLRVKARTRSGTMASTASSRPDGGSRRPEDAANKPPPRAAWSGYAAPGPRRGPRSAKRGRRCPAQAEISAGAAGPRARGSGRRGCQGGPCGRGRAPGWPRCREIGAPRRCKKREEVETRSPRARARQSVAGVDFLPGSRVRGVRERGGRPGWRRL